MRNLWLLAAVFALMAGALASYAVDQSVNETDGLVVVSDEEAADIKGGITGLVFIIKVCGAPPACGGAPGWVGSGLGNRLGTNPFPCGGTCGQRWQQVTIPPQG